MFFFFFFFFLLESESSEIYVREHLNPWACTPAERTSRFALVMRAKYFFGPQNMFFLSSIILFLKVTGCSSVLTNPHMKPRMEFIIMKIFMNIVKICPKSPRFTVCIWIHPSHNLKEQFLNMIIHICTCAYMYMYTCVHVQVCSMYIMNIKWCKKQKPDFH